MRRLIIAAALLFAATPALAQEADTTTQVSAAQNGASVQASVGGKVAIALSVNPSTGAHWDVTEKPDFLGNADIHVAPAPLAPGQRPRLGAPQMATIAFDVTAAGSGDVVLEKHGPTGGAALETFRVTVTGQ